MSTNADLQGRRPAVALCAVTKRDLRAGAPDGRGLGVACGEVVNIDDMSRGRYLPGDLAEACRRDREIKEAEVLTYDDVVLPPDRLCAERYRRFQVKACLDDLLKIAARSNTPAGGIAAVLTREGRKA